MTFGFADDERQQLAKLSTDRTMVVEIGTGLGDSAVIILENILLDGHLFTIDPLDGRSGGKAIEEITSKDLFVTIQDKLSPYKDRYTLIVGLTAMVAAFFIERSLDMVFIDAAHDYESVKTDILSWLPKVKRGGIICGHDYECPSTNCDNVTLMKYCDLDFYEGRHYGVIRAVDEIFRSEKLSCLSHANLLWWVEVD